MDNIKNIIEKKKQEAIEKQEKLTSMVLGDLWDTMQSLLDKQGYDFFVRDTPNEYGRYYDTNAPLDRQKELHNQAIDQVTAHYRSQEHIPTIIRDMITASLQEKRIV